MFDDDKEEEYNPSGATSKQEDYTYKPSYQQPPEEDTYKTAYESSSQAYQQEPPKYNEYNSYNQS